MNLYQPQPDAIPFEFGDVVYRKIDTSGEFGSGQVVAVIFRPGAITIQVQWISSVDTHYLFELTKEKPSEYNQNA